MSQGFHFQNLTPDLMLDALASVGFYPNSGLLALNSYENRVYQFVNEDNRRYVVKFYRPERWSAAQIQEEHYFAAELVAAEVPMATPILRDGQSLFDYQGFAFAIFASLGGRSFEVDNLEQLEQVGRYLGRIHQVGQSRLFQARPSMGCDEYLDQPMAILQQSSLVPSAIEGTFFHDLDQLSTELKQRWPAQIQQQRLHGDCHPSNILWRDGPLFVDLDDARNGPAVQDIWMLLHGERQDQLMQLDILLEGYEEFAQFDTKQLQLIEPLRGLRLVHYMGWLAKRWSDPAFPLAFPWFSDHKYWEGQILAIKEQLAALQEPPLSLSPQW
ncbi:Stress response kinase A [Vibrio stylophorae]|uniref:Stress response kinase A n=1 Tax=Vibrio stylophorae TaxID=659351 RepID=A0ABM8ZPI3_9VIBR|nr:serine/threonine protein kinase [Vibrio stylophorae]CAH0532216.1 Stress response kinase A [Vibrio stylophorae]